MGFIAQSRSSLENPSVPLSYPAEWLVDFFSGGRTDAGLRVSQTTALQIPAVFTCVNVVANGVASLPLNVVEIRLTPNKRLSRTLAYDHELQDLLHSRPHPEMSSKTFRFVMMVYALLWGNAHAEVLYDAGGRIAALAPRAPWKTAAIRLQHDHVIQDRYGDPKTLRRGTLAYKTTQGVSESEVISDDGQISKWERVMDPDSTLYIPGLTLDGRVGQDTVWLMRQCFGLALATEKFGSKFFGNGGHPGGVLELIGNMSQQQMEKARQSFQEATGGENMHRIFVVSGATKFTPLATPNDNAQYLETRKHQDQMIAALFQVPSHMLAESAVNRATAEQLGQEFVNYTLAPWIAALEQEMKYKLFDLPNQRGRNSGRFQPKFDTRALIYPDSESKARFYHSGKLDGYLNTNMILELEGLNPIAEEYGGEDFWQPVNMVVVGSAPPPNSGDPAGGGADPAAEEDPNSADQKPDPKADPNLEQKGAPDLTPQILAAFPLFEDAFARYSRRKKPDSKDFEQLFRPVLRSLRDGIQAVAAAELGMQTAATLPLPATDKFLFRYLEAMYQRAADFRPDAEAKRAVQALAIEIYRELAVRKVKP